ncbi:MAG: ABC-F family ATP-binding cassette domain-containing protein [Ignavibacteriae bacterium]|nr:ABC-F family ATP-binding cassette domain-containing protein [Ignavibacteriota bacterium]
MDKVFEDLTLNIDTGWRLGLIGRNGRGKSTLLKLLNKELSPVKGELHSVENTFCFPFVPKHSEETTFRVIRESIAPYSYWEIKMDELSKAGDNESLLEFGGILEKYQNANGYEIDALIRKEFAELGMNEDLLEREFSSLSGGEQTRSLIISLFLRKDSFPLIDEPTDHLDMKGRIILGEYLSKKAGFILASHDRNFLDICTDHILSINKSDVRLNKGNYSQWKYNMQIEEEFEKRRNENLKREVRSLEAAARKNRQWSGVKEKEKIGAWDKGYVGHKSAKLMKRAIHIEHRMNRKLDEKKSLLKNAEEERKLRITTEKGTDKVLSAVNASLDLDGKKIFENFSLDVFKGERVALTGDNGCGKTSFLRAIKKEIELTEGSLHIPGYITITFSDQNPAWISGSLREHLLNENIDETIFRNILGVMGAWGELFDRPLETFSRGELKKVELCKSFIKQSDLLIWDEPLNYLDTDSREQLEEVILKFKPTMLFTEHDKTFVDNVATKIINMN